MDEYQPSNVNIANNTLQKGEVREGKQLVAWDCIQDCVPERCPIGTKCVYAPQSASSGLCALQQQYLQSFVDVVFSTYRYIDDGDMYKIGMLLVPLYSQLCKQKILEKSLGYICYEDLKGKVNVHPIYKEMRETMKTITAVWREMGFTAGPNPELPREALIGKSNNGFGDPDHYKNITQNAENKRNVIR